MGIDTAPSEASRRATAMGPHDLVKLPALMRLTNGEPEIIVGVIDGPVALGQGEFADTKVLTVPGQTAIECAGNSFACTHGTLVAGILFSSKHSAVPGICPGCTLLIQPIFSAALDSDNASPAASPDELATAIFLAMDSGARILNISAAPTRQTLQTEARLQQALTAALRRGVIIIAAAGNQGAIGGSSITSHPWVLGVAACTDTGSLMNGSNVGSSVGKHGLLAPGTSTGIGADGRHSSFSGTSVAAPFVTGTAALLWSRFPKATAGEIHFAVRQTNRRRQVIPPLLNAQTSYQALQALNRNQSQHKVFEAAGWMAMSGYS